MEYKWLIIAGSVASVVLVALSFSLRRRPCENKEAQKLLNDYLDSSLSTAEIGTFYERYIGHLFEERGYYVKYHGAVKGYNDLGRDLIVMDDKDVFIIQAKCWSKNKVIKEKHIFQLYGSMVHYRKTADCRGKVVKAVFFTTTKYSEVAKKVAEDLGVEIHCQELDKNYPLIKCNVNQRGDKIYHLPFDPYYDKICIDHSKGKFYVHTVEEAVARGFRRARRKKEDEAA